MLFQGLLTKDGRPYVPPEEVESVQVDPETGEQRIVKTIVGGTP